VYPSNKPSAEEPAEGYQSRLEKGFDSKTAADKQLKNRRGANDRTRPQPRLIRASIAFLAPPRQRQ